MGNIVILIGALAFLVASPQAAAGNRVTAAGVTLEPPAGWKLVGQPDGGAKLVSPQGDIAWRFFASEPASDLRTWFDEAWRALASAHTKVDAADPDDTPTKTGLQGRAGVGILVDARGGAHILILAVVSDGKRVAPMLIEFASQDSLRRADLLTQATDSIKLVPGSPRPRLAFARGGWGYPLGGVPPAAQLAGPATDEPAPAPAPAAANAKDLPFLGKWAVGQSAYNASGSVSYGSRVYQYEFRADGTYRYHSEAWGGTFNSNWRYIIDEKGSWTASGDQLTVAPTSVTGVVRDLAGNVQKRGGPPLEKVTYRFQTTYFSGLQETQLVLTPPAGTARDGAFASNPSFPRSYLLRSNYQPAFRFPPS